MCHSAKSEKGGDVQGIRGRRQTSDRVYKISTLANHVRESTDIMSIQSQNNTSILCSSRTVTSNFQLEFLSLHICTQFAFSYLHVVFFCMHIYCFIEILSSFKFVACILPHIVFPVFYLHFSYQLFPPLYHSRQSRGVLEDSVPGV